MAVKMVEVLLLLARLASLALASAGLAIFERTFTRYSAFSFANLVLVCHVFAIAVEVAGQFVCFSRGTRPVPRDLLLCLCLLSLDGFLAVVTYSAAYGTFGITLQLYREGVLVHWWLEPNLAYGILGIVAGICTYAAALCELGIASRYGPL